MSTRPVIFISAVSGELKSARQAVANCLTSLGYTPEWQDIFTTESGPLLDMLRQKVDRSSAVLQLAGQCYGAEPDKAPPGFPRCSYTQFEALYALRRKKRVYYITLDRAFPADPHPPEPDELRELQAAYIQTIRASGDLRHPAGNATELDNKVLRLRDDLARLRLRTVQWAAGLSAAVLLIAGGVTWIILRQGNQEGTVAGMNQKLDAAAARDAALLQALRGLPSALAEAPASPAAPRETDRIAAAYATLEKDLQLPPGTLGAELKDFAARLLTVPQASPLDRALALLAGKKYAESEAAAVAARDAALSHQPPDIAIAIQCLEAAAAAATAQIHYPDALVYYQKAADLTSRERDPLEWARIQFWIAGANRYLGHYAAARAILEPVIQIRQELLGAEHPETLRCRGNLAIILHAQGKNSEASAVICDVLASFERIPGTRLDETLTSRCILAVILQAQGKHAEAEAENRAVIAIRQRVLGPDHPGTLASRSNLALVLEAQQKLTDAEAEHRAVLAIHERVQGSAHPDTLAIRNNLANTLRAQGRYVEAESGHRKVLALRTTVLGPGHPDTSASHFNLALCLMALNKPGDARAEALAAYTGSLQALGDSHPQTITAKSLLDEFQSAR